RGLKSLEFFPVWRPAMLERMRAARPILAGDVGALQVNAWHEAIKSTLAYGLGDRAQAVRERVEAGRGARGQNLGHSERGLPLGNERDLFDGQIRGTELLAAIAVALNVDQARGQPGECRTGLARDEIDLGDQPIPHRYAQVLAGAIVPPF